MLSSFSRASFPFYTPLISAKAWQPTTLEQRLEPKWIKNSTQDPLEKGMATHSSILTWKSPWIEEPGRLESTGSQRAGHDWATEHTRAHSPRGTHSNPIQGRWEQKHRTALTQREMDFKEKVSEVLHNAYSPEAEGWHVSSQKREGWKHQVNYQGGKTFQRRSSHRPSVLQVTVTSFVTSVKDQSHPGKRKHTLLQIPGDGAGQGSLACCNPWSHKESDMT